MNSLNNDTIHPSIIPHWWGGKDVLYIDSEKNNDAYNINVKILNQPPFSRSPAHGKPIYQNTIKHVSPSMLESTKGELKKRLEALLHKRKALENKKQELTKAVSLIQEHIDVLNTTPPANSGPSESNESPVFQPDPLTQQNAAQPTSPTLPISTNLEPTDVIQPPPSPLSSPPTNTAGSPSLDTPNETPATSNAENPIDHSTGPTAPQVAQTPKTSGPNEFDPSIIDTQFIDIPADFEEIATLPNQECEALRQKTEELLRAIDEEQSKIQGNLKHHETIQKIKNAALAALNELTKLGNAAPREQYDETAQKLRDQNAMLSKLLARIHDFDSRKNDEKLSRQKIIEAVCEREKAANIPSKIKTPPAQPWKTTNDTLKRSIREQFAIAWSDLSKRAAEAPEDHNTLIALKNEIESRIAAEEASAKILDSLPKPSFIQYFWSGFGHSSFGDLMDRTIKEVAATAETLFQTTRFDEQIYLESEFASLATAKTLTIGNIHELIRKTLPAARKWIKEENLSKQLKTHTSAVCDTLEGLDAFLDIILEAHNEARKKYLNKTNGGIASILAVSRHHSISTIYERLINAAIWNSTTNISEIKSSESTWSTLVAQSHKIRSALKNLAVTHSIFSKTLETARSHIKEHGSDVALSEKDVSALQRRIAANRHLNLESAVSPKHIATYEDIIKNAQNELQKLIASSKSRKSSREAITLQITNFLKEIETFQENLKSLEKTYHVNLRDVHDQLNKQRDSIEALKESSSLPRWTVLPNWQYLQKDNKVKDLNNNQIRAYQKTVNDTINAAKTSLKSITLLSEKYTTFETHFKAIEDRIVQLKSEGLDTHANRLETLFKDIKEKYKPTFPDPDIPPKEATLSSVTNELLSDTAKLKYLLNTFNENLRKTDLIRKKIHEEIDTFITEVEKNQKHLQEIETFYQINLSPLQDLLDANQEVAKGFKEKIEIRSRLLVFKYKYNLAGLESSKLKYYQQAVHTEIQKMRYRINNIANLSKAFEQHEKFLKLCTEAEIFIKSLKISQPKQLLPAIELESKLEALKNTRSITWENIKKLGWSIPSTTWDYLTSLSIWHPIDSIKHPIENITLSIWKAFRPMENLIWTALVNGAHTERLKKILTEHKRRGNISIPDQLNACWLPGVHWLCNIPKIRGELAQELRSEFSNTINKKIEASEKKLYHFSSLLDHTISQYINPNSSWFYQIDKNINDKIGELITSKDKYVVPRFQIPGTRFNLYNSHYNLYDTWWTWPSDLKDYEKKVDLLTRTLEKKVNDETHIYAVGNQHKRLAKALETAKALAENLRKKGHLAPAKKLIDLCSDNKKRLETSRDQITNLQQMKDLAIRMSDITGKLHKEIRTYKPLANKTASAIDQLVSLGSLESSEAVELHKLAIDTIRQNIDNFITKLKKQEDLVKAFDNKGAFTNPWRDKLTELIEEYKTEISPYASFMSWTKTEQPGMVYTVLNFLGITDQGPTRITEQFNLENLSITQLKILDTRIATMTSEKRDGAKNSKSRLVEFEKKSKIDALEKAQKNFKTQFIETNNFLKEESTSKLPDSPIVQNNLKIFNILFSHIQNVYDILSQNLSCGYDTQEAITFLNKAKITLQACIKNIKENKAIEPNSWATMKFLESSNRHIVSNPDYMTSTDDKIAAHRQMRYKFLTGVNPVSEKRYKAARKAAQDAAHAGYGLQLRQNAPAIAAATPAINAGIAAHKKFNDVAAAAGAATAAYAIENGLTDGELITSVAYITGMTASNRAPGTVQQKRKIAIECAAAAVATALKDKGDKKELIADGAAYGAAIASLIFSDLYYATVDQAASEAGRAAASAANKHGATRSRMRELAAAAAGRVAVLRSRSILGHPPDTAQEIEDMWNTAATAAGNMIRTLRGKDDEINAAAAAAAGQAAALREKQRHGHTEASIAERAAAAAAIKAAEGIIRLDERDRARAPLPPINKPAVLAAVIEATRLVREKYAEDNGTNAIPPINLINEAVARAAAKAAAPILANRPMGPGCIRGNLRTMELNFLNLYRDRIDAALAAVPQPAPEKIRLLNELRDNITNLHSPTINRLFQGMPGNNNRITPYEEIRSADKLLKYQEACMRACCQARSDVEELVAKINEGTDTNSRNNRPILLPILLGKDFSWNFID